MDERADYSIPPTVKATCGCKLGRAEARKRFAPSVNISWLYCDKHGDVRDPKVGRCESCGTYAYIGIDLAVCKDGYRCVCPCWQFAPD